MFTTCHIQIISPIRVYMYREKSYQLLLCLAKQLPSMATPLLPNQFILVAESLRFDDKNTVLHYLSSKCGQSHGLSDIYLDKPTLWEQGLLPSHEIRRMEEGFKELFSISKSRAIYTIKFYQKYSDWYDPEQNLLDFNAYQGFLDCCRKRWEARKNRPN